MPPSVLAPGSALGSCRDDALSSAQATSHRKDTEVGEAIAWLINLWTWSSPALAPSVGVRPHRELVSRELVSVHFLVQKTD